MSWKSGLSAGAVATLVAMSGMATTSANAFSLRSLEARYIASNICDEAGMWRHCGDHVEYVTATARSRTVRGDTSPQYMKDIDPRYNPGMLNAGGSGGGGGGGGGGGR